MNAKVSEMQITSGDEETIFNTKIVFKDGPTIVLSQENGSDIVITRETWRLVKEKADEYFERFCN